HQERFVDVLDGVALLADGGRDGVDAHRPAAELLDDGQQQLPVDLVEAVRVDFQHVQRAARHLASDRAVGPDLREIADAPQTPIRMNSWSGTWIELSLVTWPISMSSS